MIESYKRQNEKCVICGKDITKSRRLKTCGCEACKKEYKHLHYKETLKEKENVDITLKLIDEQLKKCQNGEFSDEMLNTTKRMLVNALLSSLDEMSSIVGYNLGNSILKRNYPIEENIQNVMNVTKEDCTRVFKKMKL